MIKLEPGTANPWDFKKIQDFVFYHCPECAYETQLSNEFLDHCNIHPLAKKFVIKALEKEVEYESENEHLLPLPEVILKEMDTPALIQRNHDSITDENGIKPPIIFKEIGNF